MWKSTKEERSFTGESFKKKESNNYKIKIKIMNYLEFNRAQTLYFTAKEGATIDQVLDEVRLLIACTHTMVVVNINGFQMHIDANTDYKMLKEDYNHWAEAIKEMAETAPKSAEAGRKIREVLVTQKPSNLKELKNFCENMLEDIENIPGDTPLEEVEKIIENQRK